MAHANNITRRSALAGTCALLAAAGVGARVPAAAGSASVTGPLGDPSRARLVWRVTANGYAAEEFLLSGTAAIYEPVSMADAIDTATRDNTSDQARRIFDRKRIAEDEPYVTRLIVYSPTDITRFSGNVVIETAHPGGGGSNLVWEQANSGFMAAGDIYVAVAHPVTLPGLAAAAPDRYASLHAKHPSQLWRMLADSAKLARTQSSRLMRGARPRRIYLTGYSFTGVATSTFANYHHREFRLADGVPIFDGYLSMANAMYVRPLDVPVIRINTQSDFDSFGGVGNRSPDNDSAQGRFRHYEVAGASHVFVPWPHANSALPPEGGPIAAAAGQPKIVEGGDCTKSFPAGHLPNDYPLSMVTLQAFDNLYQWVDHNVLPPRVQRLELDAAGHAKLDAIGNALGGLRLTPISIPTSQYGVGGGGFCFLFGYRVPLGAVKCREIHGSHARYLTRVKEANREHVQQRLISNTAAMELTAQARASPDF
jgi:hypothetical protein